MCSAAIAGSGQSASVRAQAANRSRGAVINVGKKRVTPVVRKAAMASAISPAPMRGSLKSTPANPLTCRSKKPESATCMSLLERHLGAAPGLAGFGRLHEGHHLEGDLRGHGRRAAAEELHHLDEEAAVVGP